MAVGVGTALLRAIIDNREAGVLRDLNANLFDEDEQQYYDFMVGYQREYGKLPSLDVMSENNLSLRKVSKGGTTAYLLDRLLNRALWQDISPDVQELVSAMESRDMKMVRKALQQMSLKSRDRDTESLITNIGREAADLLKDLQTRGIEHLSIPTGWPALDAGITGIGATDFVILAGRTNIGKSYFLLSMVVAAWKAMYRPLVITMEMGVRQLATRMVGMESGINPRFLKERTLGTLATRALAETVTDFQLRPPMSFVSGHKLQGVEHVEGIIQEIEPDITYIDAAYLLKLAKAGNTRASRFEILETVMEYLQGIVVRTNRPIVITVQLGRGQSSKSSDLSGAIDKIRGSDAIAQLGSVVVASAPCDGVHAQTRRVHRLVKNREGPKEFEWWTKFEFSPRMDFSETVIEAVQQRTSTVRGMV